MPCGRGGSGSAWRILTSREVMPMGVRAKAAREASLRALLRGKESPGCLPLAHTEFQVEDQYMYM
jgi:hypothetical protein